MEITHNFEDLQITKMKKNNENLRKELPYLIESQQLVAKYTFARYKAFVDSGFSKEDALWLCK